MTLYLPAVAGLLAAAASLAVWPPAVALGLAALAYLAWLYSPLPDVSGGGLMAAGSNGRYWGGRS